MNRRPVSYLQTDKRWKDKHWNGMTIGKAGCGPTSAAMLISTLTGKEVTPADTYAWAGKNGHLEKGHGTNYVTYFQRQFALYGLKAEMLSWQNTYGKPDHPNHEKVRGLLEEGYYAIALMGPGRWTSGGHFVVLWWQDGKVRINDPASTKAERVNGEIQTFRSQVKYYWVVDAREHNKTEEGEAMTGKEIYEKLQEYLGEQELPEWAKAEYQEAVEMGITDGNDPMRLIPRYQAAIMAKRAKEA